MTDDYRISVDVQCHQCEQWWTWRLGIGGSCPCGAETVFEGRDRIFPLDGQIPFQGLGDLPDGVGVQE
jgi:hypothetical protein